ncbi:prolipoprotein diacylglyceryl transferase [Winogradskyella sp. MIT101101]|uniref:prolipoprotein diacylglyceryl transferase n=1 Tax=Winogradskyella sp. MIT101101 TaxID=3098297 RepID=UPI00399A9D41
MYPELFQLNLPEFINSLFSINTITIYSYPFCILIGSIVAYHYFIYAQSKYIGSINLKLNFVLLIIVMAYLGGKTFLVLDDASSYLDKVLSIEFYSSSGFVFYGSFLFCLFTVVLVLKKKKLPVLKYLDLIAIVTAIVHSAGRLGCFLAGCCYGKPTDSIFGVQFPENSIATVHPTQLYESIFIVLLLVLLLKLLKSKNDGTVFTFYVLSYAVWRFLLEYLRGDQRGYVFNGFLSHSQLIALSLIFLSATLLLINSKRLKFTR